MSIDISVCLYSSNPNLWKGFAGSVKRGASTFSFEIVIAGPPHKLGTLPSGVRFIPCDKSPAECLAAAIEASTGKYIAWSKDTAKYERGSLRSAATSMNHKSGTFVGFRFYSDAAGNRKFNYGSNKIAGMIPVPLGMMPRKMYFDVGGINKKFKSIYAEWDLSLRAQKSGNKLILTDEIEVYVYRSPDDGNAQLMTEDYATLHAVWAKKASTSTGVKPDKVPLEGTVGPFEIVKINEVKPTKRKDVEKVKVGKVQRKKVAGTIAVIMVRGRGTTLPNKNAYLLNGVPLLDHFLKEMRKVKCLDEICVWTEDPTLAKIGKKYKCVILKRPKTMLHYKSGFHTSEEWNENVNSQLIEHFGKMPTIRVHLNCNFTLITAKSIEKMYDKLLEGDAFGICAVAKAPLHLYNINPLNGKLFPVYDLPGLDKQKTPPLYHRIGIEMRYDARKKFKGQAGWDFLEVSRREGWDIESEGDIEYAEFVLRQRAEKQKRD